MVHHFPGTSLILQLFRQMTKPTSRKIVNYAARHPIFKKYFLLKPGRAYYRIETRIQMLKAPTVTVKDGDKQLEKPKILTIKDEEAVEIGSQLMIEVVLFALLVVLMIIDYIRSQLKSAREDENYQLKLETVKQRKIEAVKRLQSLEHETELLRTRLVEQMKIVQDSSQADDEEKGSSQS